MQQHLWHDTAGGQRRSATMANQAAMRGGSPADAGKLPFPLQDNEDVLLVVRRHWVFLWPRTIFLALVALLPPLAVSLLLAWADAYDGIVAKVFWVVAGLYILYWAVRAFFNWYRFHNDIWVITNQRIVDSVKKHPFNLELSTADLVNIQDMTVSKGMFGSMLNFGNIVCETASAGGEKEFHLSGIPRPQDVQLLVDRERDRERMRGRS
jgi:hypothetical protein